MSWKQPIRSSMPEFGEDAAAETLYVLLLRSAANSEKKFLIDDQVVTLQRGQTVYGRYSYAKKLGLKRNEGQRVDRTLSRLAKVHNKINISPKNKFSLITLKNYEEEVEMNTNSNNSMNNEQTTDKQQINTYKSVESVESEKENANFFVKKPINNPTHIDTWEEADPGEYRGGGIVTLVELINGQKKITEFPEAEFDAMEGSA